MQSHYLFCFLTNEKIIIPKKIVSIAGLKHGGVHRNLTTLLKHSLVHHDRRKYDGYRLTYMAYDFLAIKAMLNRGSLTALGRKIGIGKESFTTIRMFTSEATVSRRRAGQVEKVYKFVNKEILRLNKSFLFIK